MGFPVPSLPRENWPHVTKASSEHSAWPLLYGYLPAGHCGGSVTANREQRAALPPYSRPTEGDKNKNPGEKPFIPQSH